jgi:hypothetical protein
MIRCVVYLLLIFKMFHGLMNNTVYIGAKFHKLDLRLNIIVCVCVCVCACALARARVCVCVCVSFVTLQVCYM